jgi:glycosyltransferase involved in cell wall biosynthesis
MAENSLVQDAQTVITCSDAMSREVQDYFGAAHEKVLVIPNGVYPGQFDALRGQDLTAFRAAYAAPGEPLVFNLGRLVYEKGTDLLVEAVPRVLDEVPTARFVIGGSGPMATRLENRVQELGLAGRVRLTGFLAYEQRDRLYMVADCAVFPSRYEPFGIVALEAMAAGTPVVVSHVGGLGSVVTNGVTGVTVDSEDVEALAWGIIRSLQDPQEARQRAERALHAVLERFSWPLIARMTVDIYHRVANTATWLPDS